MRIADAQMALESGAFLTINHQHAMATIFTHAVVAAAIGSAFAPRWLPRRWWLLGAACAMLPDADVVGFAFGVHYGDFWGHRGFTHSLCFAAILAVLITAICYARPVSKLALVCYLFLATASHGVLDALTDGGLGIAFFSPFDTGRYFFPFTPVPVSPIGAGFFSAEGAAVLRHEAIWLGLPAAISIIAFTIIHRYRSVALEPLSPKP